MNKKAVIIVLLLGILVILSVQNSFNVGISFFFWKINLPLSVVMLLLFLIGFIIGMFVRKSSLKRK